MNADANAMRIQNAIEQAWNDRGVPLPDDAADLMFVAAEAALSCFAAELDRRADEITELGGKFVEAQREVERLRAKNAQCVAALKLAEAYIVADGVK